MQDLQFCKLPVSVRVKWESVGGGDMDHSKTHVFGDVLLSLDRSKQGQQGGL